MVRRNLYLVIVALLSLVLIPWSNAHAEGVLETIGGIFSGVAGAGLSAATGGIVGFVGSCISAFAQHKQREQEQRFQREKWDYELKMIDAQSKLRETETENELKIVSTQGSWAGLTSAIQADGALPSAGKFVDGVRGLFRPILTIMLIGVFVWMFNKIMDGLSGDRSTFYNALGPIIAKEIVVYMVYSITFTVTAAALFWFGERAFRPKGVR